MGVWKPVVAFQWLSAVELLVLLKLSKSKL